jgi:hypothetical protein
MSRSRRATVTDPCPATACGSAPASASGRLGDRLRAEWERLRHDPATVRHAGAWRLTEAPVGDLDDVLAAIGYGVATTAATETALHRLVATASIDPLAGRVVLQRVLPALLTRAARRAGATAAALDELVGAAWIAITTYDVARTPGCLAAALVADAEHRAFRAPARRRWTGEVPADVDFDSMVAARDGEADTLQELAGVFRLARVAGVAPDDLDLLRRLLAADRAEDVAAELRVTSRTIRNRRARITEQLRALAA